MHRREASTLLALLLLLAQETHAARECWYNKYRGDWQFTPYISRGEASHSRSSCYKRDECFDMIRQAMRSQRDSDVKVLEDRWGSKTERLALEDNQNDASSPLLLVGDYGCPASIQYSTFLSAPNWQEQYEQQDVIFGSESLVFDSATQVVSAACTDKGASLAAAKEQAAAQPDRRNASIDFARDPEGHVLRSTANPVTLGCPMLQLRYTTCTTIGRYPFREYCYEVQDAPFVDGRCITAARGGQLPALGGKRHVSIVPALDPTGKAMVEGDLNYRCPTVQEQYWQCLDYLGYPVACEFRLGEPKPEPECLKERRAKDPSRQG